jgi:protein SCO1
MARRRVSERWEARSPRVPGATVLAAFLLAAGLAGCGGSGGGSTTKTTSSALDGMTPVGLVAPNFALRDQHGQLVSLAQQRGKFVVVTFLYTHCKNVCPVIAGQLNQALRDLGPARNQLRVLAVSVDPKHDTPAAVDHFIAVHRLLPQFLYLTGTVPQLSKVWNDFHVASVPDKGGIVVSHTAIEFLLDRNGKPRAIYDSQLTAGELVHDLRILGLQTSA